MKHTLSVLFALTSLLLLTPAMADNHHAKSEAFTVQQVTDSIYMLQGRGGNIGVSKGQDGLLMIDSDYPDLTQPLIAMIEQLGGLDQLHFLLNTHWHGDHTGGNQALAEHTHIVAHRNVRERLSTRQEIKLFNAVIEATPAEKLPRVTYDSELDIHFNGDALKVVHYAGGHTDGDSVVYFEKDNVVHTGDLFFNGIFPFVDLGSGGNVLRYTAHVETIINRIDSDTKVIPGHGPLTNRNGLKLFHDMLVQTTAEVKAMKDDGLSVADAQAQGLSDRWESWGKGFLPEKVWISIVYNSL